MDNTGRALFFTLVALFFLWLAVVYGGLSVPASEGVSSYANEAVGESSQPIVVPTQIPTARPTKEPVFLLTIGDDEDTATPTTVPLPTPLPPTVLPQEDTDVQTWQALHIVGEYKVTYEYWGGWFIVTIKTNNPARIRVTFDGSDPCTNWAMASMNMLQFGTYSTASYEKKVMPRGTVVRVCIQFDDQKIEDTMVIE